MEYQISDIGGADKALSQKAVEYFRDAARKTGRDVDGLSVDSPIDQQIAWADSRGFSIGTTYLRYSTKIQHSTDDQLRENVTAALRLGIYIPPQLICLDEAKKGRSNRRTGLTRLKAILQSFNHLTIVLFKLSRLFRNSYKSQEFVTEHVVERGHRAIVFSDGIDTADGRAWKAQVSLRGIFDDLYVDNLVDHIRAGLKGIFENRWTVGALPVGYRAKFLPDAPMTNLKKPRSMPEVDPKFAPLIVQHFQWISDGMSLREGLRRWIAAGGPFDPRSKTKRMTSSAYRRMLSNIRFTGRWEYGRRKSVWSSTKDYSVPQIQPDEEVVAYSCEDLRIVSDELFLAVQRRLAELKLGPRGPKKDRPVQLWDLTTEFFFCAACSTIDEPVRFHQTGAHGLGMQCKNGDQCPCNSAVRREDAVRAICHALDKLVHQNERLISEILSRSKLLAEGGDTGLRDEIAQLESRDKSLSRKIDGLSELVGEGSDLDREELKAKIRSSRRERTLLQQQLLRAKRSLERSSRTLTGDDVRQILDNFANLLVEGGSGNLGGDAIYRALAVFKALTGGCIMVHVEKRAGRKQTNVRGRFLPMIVQALQTELNLPISTGNPELPEVEVWLREPPLRDRLAHRVHELIDIQKLSYRAAAKQLQSDGHAINSGIVWQIYARYYEMIGQPKPEREYNNGHPRQPE